jgi:hypothetical protein
VSPAVWIHVLPGVAVKACSKFKPGQAVIWEKTEGNYFRLTPGTVVAFTAKRVKIAIQDPKDKKRLIFRNVAPETLKVGKGAVPLLQIP